ncbi:uncharacterized protein B0I36DRAFT_358645 [Microdochium trichocladiopsis]|uniref:Uncharacterized protein n=1 Tax=Microdochium trichocladiopsis TaxID=1682393 RepID=A0A9P8YJC9_9PEZI|nr:uncharacterized protein B0I36DRAFT_358645 [Microdochium trichocladiopsis]KAH7041479.1 hypothetical protein B0I36DRAFT_358645 [Microdochium trichocladiopsis]
MPSDNIYSGYYANPGRSLHEHLNPPPPLRQKYRHYPSWDWHVNDHEQRPRHKAKVKNARAKGERYDPWRGEYAYSDQFCLPPLQVEPSKGSWVVRLLILALAFAMLCLLCIGHFWDWWKVWHGGMATLFTVAISATLSILTWLPQPRNKYGEILSFFMLIANFGITGFLTWEILTSPKNTYLVGIKQNDEAYWRRLYVVAIAQWLYSTLWIVIVFRARYVVKFWLSEMMNPASLFRRHARGRSSSGADTDLLPAPATGRRARRSR